MLNLCLDVNLKCTIRHRVIRKSTGTNPSGIPPTRKQVQVTQIIPGVELVTVIRDPRPHTTKKSIGRTRGFVHNQGVTMSGTKDSIDDNHESRGSAQPNEDVSRKHVRRT